MAIDAGHPRGLVAELARTRDPNGFATLTTLCESSGVNFHTTQLALRRIATIVAAKGGQVADINIGDCLELLRIVDDVQASASASSPYFYQLLRTAGIFGERAPAVRALKTKGQLSCEQLIDRYAIACGPIRDLLVDYLRERQPGVDTQRCTNSPTRWADCSGATWRSITPASARCVCPPRSRPPGNSGSTPRSAGSRTATGNPARKRCRGSTRPITWSRCGPSTST